MMIMKGKVYKTYIQLDQLKKIKGQRVESKKNKKCYKKEAKSFPMYKSNKRVLKVKKLIKQTLKLHHVHQRRDVLRTPSNI